ncbi:response regulator transcription factor [Bacillus sp. 31A1R]|uniref:Response regulator transcription factor n=1 Tax=Robertmurraya mangrovi TaxID=3098077 RepID=A0ABU5J3I9_9BACI|nr:response regulator transcription factor [Bacillus sp. 31A1R]MDZ5473927.1 response regulator transcription factor [Bacillus sp. 31A1R]
MKTLLLVDDELRMLRLLKIYLEPHGYKCVTTTSGSEAISIIEKEKIDLVLLDLMMPDMNGWDTAKELRSFSDVPIIMLTARDTSSDVVEGLRIGADDYVTKPFEEKVLLARIEAVLRRVTGSNVITVDNLTWDDQKYEITYLGNKISLTRKEFDFVGLLLKNKGTVFTRERLLERIWGYTAETEDRTVDSHVRNIRDKFKRADYPINNHLLTVWGMGYKWE